MQLLLGFSALEAHVSGVADELRMRNGLNIMDHSILSERDVVLENGEFQLTDKLKMYRLEDRLSYLFAKFGNATSLAKFGWWNPLKEGMRLRNQLVHPKAGLDLSIDEVAKALLGILDCLNELYVIIFGKGHPSYNRKLDSNLSF